LLAGAFGRWSLFTRGARPRAPVLPYYCLVRNARHAVLSSRRELLLSFTACVRFPYRKRQGLAVFPLHLRTDGGDVR